MTTNKPMTGEQLDELLTVAVNMQRDAETDCNPFDFVTFVLLVIGALQGIGRLPW